MAEKESMYDEVPIWHPSGAMNIVPRFELPYWTSQVGGSWTDSAPGSMASEMQDDSPAPAQSGTAEETGAPVQGPEVPAFSYEPNVPGSVIKRNDRGRFSLVFFQDDPTPEDPNTGRSYWIYDSNDKSFRPITSEQQLDTFIKAHGGTGAQEAMKLAINLDPASIKDPSLGWEGEFLGMDFSPQEDGSLPFYDNPNLVSEALTDKYGATSRNIDEEKVNEQRIRQVMNLMASNGTISQESLQRIEDPNGTLLAKYVSATTYGGYSMGEIWQDLRIKELATEDPSYVGKTAISDTLKRDDYRATDEYNEITRDPNMLKPMEALSDGAYLLNIPLGRIDDSFFQELVPTFDWNDPAMQEKVKEIQAEWFDLALAQSNATTEQQKAIADGAFDRFIKDLNRQYGLKLSNNARTAWGQLQEATGTMQGRGLSGSGIEREAQDRILADIRRSDDLIRQTELDQEEAKRREFLLNYADESQIAEAVDRMDREDAEAGLSPSQYRSRTWGLTPSQETLDWFSTKALTERFPNLSKKEIELMRGQLIDPNDRFRSKLYRQSIGKEFETGRSKETFQQQEFKEFMNRAREKAQRKSQQFEPSLSSYKPPETLTGDDKMDRQDAPQTVTPPKKPDVTPTDDAFKRTDAVTEMLDKAEKKRKKNRVK